jgi:hypothetical protein
MAKDKDIINEALENWRIAESADQENRELALSDKKFAKLGGKHQWPEKVWEDRKQDNRPCLTINRMPQFLKQVINDQRMNKPSITVRPVDDQGDVQIAQIYQGLIRNIEVTSNADRAYDLAFDDAVTMGFGFFRIVTEYAHDDTFEQDIRIKAVENAFTIHLDPTDWLNPKFAFVEEMVKRDAFKRRYGFLPKAVSSSGAGTSMEGWYDGDLVRVAEYWRVGEQKKKLLQLSTGETVYADKFNAELAYAAGIQVNREREVFCPTVKQYLMTGQELADEPVDWAGKYIPIIPVVGECINIEGKKHLHGLIRHARDPQQMFNFWRTATTELVALAPKAPFVGAVGQFDTESDKWANANVKTYSKLEYDVVDGAPPPQRQPFAGVPAGALQEALNASDDMKSVMGLYDASLGNRSNETSGIAIRARKQEGDVSTFNFMDGFARDSLTHAGRILIDLIPKIYDSARVLRIIGPDDEPTTVRIKQSFMHPDGKEGYYDLSMGKYDVVVKVGPNFTTQREEVRDAILEFIRVYPQSAPVLGDILAKNMDWPEADEIARRLQALLPPMVQGGPDPQAQQMQQAIQELTEQIKKLEGDRTMESRKLDIDAHKAETDRLKVLGATITPELVAQIAQQTVMQALQSPDVLPGGPPMAPPTQEQPPTGGFFMPEGQPPEGQPAL